MVCGREVNIEVRSTREQAESERLEVEKYVVTRKREEDSCPSVHLY